MKRLFVMITSALLLLAISVLPVFAADGSMGITTVGATDTTTIGALVPHVEGGSSLTADETKELEELAAKTSEKVNAGLYVVFSGAQIADVKLEADSILRSKLLAGGGYGDNNDAIILYVNLNDSGRQYAIVEDSDNHAYRLSDKFVKKHTSDSSKIRTQLSEGKYFDAAKTFLSEVEDELNPNIFKALWWRILAALGIGGGAAGIAAGAHKSLKKTRKRHYLKDNRINVLEKNERLTGTDVTRNVKKSASSTGNSGQAGTGHGGSNTF